MRRAFTLVELILASGLGALVLAQLVVVMVGVFRLGRETGGSAELALRMREAREKILFRSGANADGADAFYGGLLSATNVCWEGNQIAASFQSVGSDKGVATFDSANRQMENRFLAPIVAVSPGDSQQEGEQSDSLLYVTVSAQVGGRTRVEKLVVPVFGKGQEVLPGGVYRE